MVEMFPNDQIKKISSRGRIIIGFHTFWCLAITYMQRLNVNVVIAQIITINGPEEGKIQWTQLQKSLALMSFYAGYCFMQIIGGICAERFGSKITLFTSISVSTILCFISPSVMEKNFSAFIVIRIIMGLAQASFFPCFTVIIANWFPVEIRATAIGLIFPGTYLGNILALCITSGLAFNRDLWPVSFYLFGGCGIMWLVFWHIFMTDDPKNNRWITNEEKEYLSRISEREQVTNFKMIPWKKMMTSLPLVAVVMIHFSANWSGFLIVTIIPSLMEDLYYIPVKNQTYITFLAPILTWIGGSGFCLISDYLLARNKIEKKLLRKICSFFALFPVGILLMLATFVPHNLSYVGVTLVLLACLFTGVYISVSMTNIGDIAPQYYGMIAGISNTFGALGGVVAIQTSYTFVSDTHNPREWQNVVILMLVIQAVGFFTFIFYAQSTIQPWAIQKTKQSTLKDPDSVSVTNL